MLKISVLLLFTAAFQIAQGGINREITIEVMKPDATDKILEVDTVKTDALQAKLADKPARFVQGESEGEPNRIEFDNAVDLLPIGTPFHYVFKGPKQDEENKPMNTAEVKVVQGPKRNAQDKIIYDVLKFKMLTLHPTLTAHLGPVNPGEILIERMELEKVVPEEKISKFLNGLLNQNFETEYLDYVKKIKGLQTVKGKIKGYYITFSSNVNHCLNGATVGWGKFSASSEQLKQVGDKTWKQFSEEVMTKGFNSLFVKSLITSELPQESWIVKGYTLTLLY